MARSDDRSPTSLRPISFETGFIAHHPGSVLVSFGGTRVLVTCTAENRVPSFRLHSGGGWVTADYQMLAASTHERRKKNPQRPDGRSMEIQRLIGRAVRNVVDLSHLGQRTLNLDCDVIQADGGTRTASITGAYVALRLCLEDLAKKPDGISPAAIDKILTGQVAAVSLGVVSGEILTDLCYEEDSKADTDLNLIARHDGTIIEVQGTAEGAPLTRAELDGLVDQGLAAIEELCAHQRQAIERALT